MSKTDFIAAVAALATHAGIAWGLSAVKPLDAPKPSVVEVDVRKKQLPPPPPKIETPPEPPKPEPERKVVEKVKKMPPPTTMPPPNKTVPEPPKEPPKPVFGINMESTTEGDSTFSVPVGNTTMIDPKDSSKDKGPIQPLPPAPAGPVVKVVKPVSEVYIKTPVEIDAEGCGRDVKYPSEAEQLGIEGAVVLKILYDESGKVDKIRVVSGLGHGLDEVAMNAMKHSRACRAKPAVGTDGKAVAQEIKYTFHFEIPR
jgi:protein TonB